MSFRENLIVAKFLSLTIFVFLSISGFGFLSNQYIYYRYLEDADLPYGPPVIPRNSSIPDPDKGKRDRVQATTAKMISLLNILGMIPAIISSCLIGWFSDIYGRRLSIAVLVIGSAINSIITVLVIIFKLPVLILLIGNTIYGIFGGGLISFAGQIAVCFADITTISDATIMASGRGRQATQERKRLRFLGYFDGASCLSNSLSCALTGLLIDHAGFVPTCLFLLVLFSIGVGNLWLIPETKLNNITTQTSDSDSQLPSRINCENTWSSQIVELFNIIREASSTVYLILVILLLITMNTLIEGQFTFLYLMAPPFCWSASQFGLYSALNAALSGLVSISLILITAHYMKSTKPTQTSENEPLLTQEEHSLHDSDIVSGTENIEIRDNKGLPVTYVLRARRRMIKYLVIGISSIAISRQLLGFAFLIPSPGHTAFVYIALFIALARSAIFPTIKSFLSSLHRAELQSRMFSLIAVTEYFGILLGYLTLPYIYSGTVTVFPGAVFLVSAGLVILALGLVLYIFYQTKMEVKHLNVVNNAEIIINCTT